MAKRVKANRHTSAGTEKARERLKEAVEAGREVMRKYRNALRKLAE